MTTIRASDMELALSLAVRFRNSMAPAELSEYASILTQMVMKDDRAETDADALLALLEGFFAPYELIEAVFKAKALVSALKAEQRQFAVDFQNKIDRNRG